MEKYTTLHMCLDRWQISQSKLAEILGINKATVNPWVKGLKPIPEKWIEVLCKLFRVQREYLVDENRFAVSDMIIKDKLIWYFDTQVSDDKKNGLDSMEEFKKNISNKGIVDNYRKKSYNKLRKILPSDTNEESVGLNNNGMDKIVYDLLSCVDDNIFSVEEWNDIISCIKYVKSLDGEYRTARLMSYSIELSNINLEKKNLIKSLISIKK